MKTWLIVVLFFAGMFLDSIIFPAFFSFRESFLTIIFLVVIFLNHDVNLRSLILGIALSVSAEFYWGLKLGALVLPLLASAGAFFLLNRFFNIRSRVLMILSGIVMFIVFWEMSVLINRIL